MDTVPSNMKWIYPENAGKKFGLSREEVFKAWCDADWWWEPLTGTYRYLGDAVCAITKKKYVVQFGGMKKDPYKRRRTDSSQEDDMRNHFNKCFDDLINPLDENRL